MMRPGMSSRISPGRKIGWLAISVWLIVPSDAAVALPTRFVSRPVAPTRPISLSPAVGEAVGLGAGEGCGVAAAMRTAAKNESKAGQPYAGRYPRELFTS